MTDLAKLTKNLIDFRDARDWKQFHNPKDQALSLTLEAAEVLEHFQWKSQKEIDQYIQSNKKEIGDELIDVLNYLLYMFHDLDIDIEEAWQRKIKENHEKYPVKKAKGKHTKYNKL